LRAAKTPQQVQEASRFLRAAVRGHLRAIAERYILEGETADLLHNAEVKRAYLGKGYKEVWE
jgi:hypothetical protein